MPRISDRQPYGGADARKRLGAEAVAATMGKDGTSAPDMVDRLTRSMGDAEGD